MNLDEKDTRLLSRCARFYATSDYELDDKIKEDDLERLIELLKNPEIEKVFNECILEIKNKWKKKKNKKS